MFCSRCGKQLEPSSRFCPSCGASINPAATPFSDSFHAAGKLTRPLTGRMIAGVCAAFALHYGWDLNLVRIITALFIVLTGVGALAYIVAWVVIPEEAYPLTTKSI
jgi:phage shock protein C